MATGIATGRAEARGAHVDGGRTRSRRPRGPRGRIRDGPALHQGEQPVARRPPDGRARPGVPRRPGRDRDRDPGGPQLLPDQSREPGRRPLEQVDRRDDGRARAGRGPRDRGPRRPPGRAHRVGEEAGLERIARGIDEVHARTGGFRVRIDLETTAGQGSCLGAKFEHLGRIIDLVAEPERLGICGDTCHIHAAGYPLATPTEYDETIGALERAGGAGRLRVWHLNDSLRERGSRVDRHAGIGRGHLGVDPFRHVVNDPRWRDVPMVLETPKGLEAGEDLDAINLRLLRSLLKATGG